MTLDATPARGEEETKVRFFGVSSVSLEFTSVALGSASVPRVFVSVGFYAISPSHSKLSEETDVSPFSSEAQVRMYLDTLSMKIMRAYCALRGGCCRRYVSHRVDPLVFLDYPRVSHVS